MVLYSKRAMSKDDMIFAGMDYVAMAAYMHELAGYLEGSRTVA